jgi:hypothetical protein
MPMPNTRVLTLALAAILALGTLDAASARSKKQSARTGSAESAFWGSLVPVENGIPVIMKGYHPPRSTVEEAPPQQRADRPIKIPRGSSTYIPPPNPSPYSRMSPPAASLTQPAPAPYMPPPITTFSDRVTGAIHAYPLEKGIGNNPIDQQQFIRQRANQ